MNVRISMELIRAVLEARGVQYTDANIKAVKAAIPDHLTDMVLAVVDITKMPDAAIMVPMF
ncbi:hypothetical protein [Bifidobacterium sp. SO1]|uniref:hypothetical protein n=1 Tax=Bifidobacterium sp. SO1 TaxID=2809029 RepID=UPI001BDD2B98|nr:hypothetical protein [Bifidobacterium sp. SO1]MBT1161236.1 hypothetical protein [Bifidobacterium sp. SO1]